MIPIANQPILFYGLRHIAQAGIRDVAIILGPIEEGIREGVGDGSRFGLHVEYIVQGDPRGLAHAVQCAKRFLGDSPFLMYLGDNLLQAGVSQFVELFNSQNPDAVVGATPVAHPQGYGIVELAGERIVSIEEKPTHPRSNLALIGVYLFTPEVHPIIAKLVPSRRGELEITDAIWGLWQARGKVSVLRVSGWWKDTGHPRDLLEANELVLRTMTSEEFRIEGIVREGARVEGPVGIGPGSIIEADAHVTGPAVIGSDVRVGSGGEVGPYCAIGNRAVIDRSSVRHSIVMDGARLDGVSITQSLIGRNVEVQSSGPMTRSMTLTLGDSSKILLG
jgi:glucose-1-phosphate thymidylyltransferase